MKWEKMMLKFFGTKRKRVNNMVIKVNIKELIETVVDITVEHYVDTMEDSMRYSHREIKDKNIDTMKNDLIKKLTAILEEKSE